MAEQTQDAPVPPVGEEVHLPGPTLLPLFVAVGITILLVGVTVWVGLVIAGAIVTVWASLRWIADTRRDIAELPTDHS